jgi:urease accessory protein
MNVTVHDDGAFFLLPDPVCCFRSASYHQIQTFRLSPKASLIVLDWFNSGRKSLGEDWSFARYYSTNEIWINDNRIAKDVMLLENDADNIPSLGRRPLAVRLAPYSCYATILFHGPLLKGIVEDLGQQFSSLSVFKHHSPDDLLWSLSPTSEGGTIVRVAGKDTESVKDWLKNTLNSLEDIVGVDVFRRTFI